MIKTIIIDDETHAREAIALILTAGFKKIILAGEAYSVKSGIEIINKEKPDLIFLDIDLPDGSGFDILKAIDYKKTKVIFVTAFHEYAIQAIKFSAFDYILKPLKRSELISTVNRVIEESLESNYTERFEAIFSNFNSGQSELKKIVLKTAEKIYIVNIKDIVHCESENTYTTFYLSNGKKILVSKPIKKYDELLSGYGFMRVHQSHLVNLNYIQHLNKQDGGILVLTNNTEIHVSNQQKPMLLKYFESL